MLDRYRRSLGWLAVLVAAVGAAGIVSSEASSAPIAKERCSPGAHTLAAYGSRLYPEMGNGGYTSLHTELDLRYDAASDEFLPGNHVVLTDRADQCLSSFSLDFERKSADQRQGPDMRVESVEVDGRPAHFSFVQPTYPGDPNGPRDPDPRAHEASELDPVGGPGKIPFPRPARRSSRPKR